MKKIVNKAALAIVSLYYIKNSSLIMLYYDSKP